MSTDGVLANLLAWSLQITAVVCAGGALPTVLRVNAPDLRHGYWRALLLVCLLLPVVQPWQAGPEVTGGVAAFKPAGLAPAGIAQPFAPSARPPSSRLYNSARPMVDTVALLLAAGAVVRLAWLGLGLIRLRRLRRAGRPPGMSLSNDELGPLAGAGADVRLVATLRQPITFGAWRPVVLLPAALQRQPEPVRRAVLVHELWHVRRRDWLWVVIEEAVRALFWFHPVVGWLVTRVQSSREEVVDELTVLTTNSRRTYIEALLLFADEPGVYPATSFARRRHLFRRVLLISKEAVMSSKRVVASCAAMGAVVVLAGWYGVEAFPMTAAPPAAQRATPAPPRDSAPGRAAARLEPGTGDPRHVECRTAVGGALPGAGQATGSAWRRERGRGNPGAGPHCVPGRPQRRHGVGDALQPHGPVRADRRDAGAGGVARDVRPKAQHLIATFYEEKVRKDSSLSPGDRLRYIQAGIAAEDRALQLSPDYVDAMIVKNILWRHQATGETNAAARAQLIADADALRNRAIQLQQSRQLLNGASQPTAVQTGAPAGMPPPPPPPPPPPGQTSVDGLAPVRVGGAIKPPVKLVNVPPVYPEEAKASQVQGVVIIEAIIDTAGNVSETRVLRSIPLLDQAAVDAVKQWQFTPTLMNGSPVPVIMTTTVNFTLQ